MAFGARGDFHYSRFSGGYEKKVPVATSYIEKCKSRVSIFLSPGTVSFLTIMALFIIREDLASTIGGVLTGTTFVVTDDFLKSNSDSITRASCVGLAALSFFVSSQYVITAALIYFVYSRVEPVKNFLKGYYGTPEIIAEPNENSRSTYSIQWLREHETSDLAMISAAFKRTVFCRTFNAMIEECKQLPYVAKVLSFHEYYTQPMWEKILAFRLPEVPESVSKVLCCPFAPVINALESRTRTIRENFDKAKIRLTALFKPTVIAGIAAYAFYALAIGTATYWSGIVCGAFIPVTKNLVKDGDWCTRIVCVASIALTYMVLPTFIYVAAISALAFTYVPPLNKFMVNYFGILTPADNEDGFIVTGAIPSNDMTNMLKTLKTTNFFISSDKALRESGEWMIEGSKNIWKKLPVACTQPVEKWLDSPIKTSSPSTSK